MVHTPWAIALNTHHPPMGRGGGHALTLPTLFAYTTQACKCKIEKINNVGSIVPITLLLICILQLTLNAWNAKWAAVGTVLVESWIDCIPNRTHIARY